MKANTLSLATKGLSALLVAGGCVMAIIGHEVPMDKLLMGAGFIAASFITVDISKIKTATNED